MVSRVLIIPSIVAPQGEETEIPNKQVERRLKCGGGLGLAEVCLA